jgi:transglutaminase-like putative cysteine protease
MDVNTMLQRLTVNHETTYSYHRPVMPGEHFLMFRPRDSHDSRLLDATLTIEPQAKLRWLHDVFGNSVTIATFDQPTDRLYFKSQIVIDRYPYPALEFPIEPFAQTIPFSYPLAEIPDLGRTIERHYSDPDRLVTEWTRSWLLPPAGSHVTETFLRALNSSIHNDLRYEERFTPGVQTPVKTLQRGAGTCRDFALLMMEAVRTVGLAARFVSGYLYDPAIDGSQSDVTGAGSTHAWVQVYLPGAGWVEFDPTNASYGGQNLIPVAVAREPIQAMPVSGTYDGAPEDFIDMSVNVEVRAVHVMDQAG